MQGVGNREKGSVEFAYYSLIPVPYSLYFYFAPVLPTFFFNFSPV